KPNPKTSKRSAHTTITRFTKAAGSSPSATTKTAPPGSTHPTADHHYAGNADHSSGHYSGPPPTHHDVREPGCPSEQRQVMTPRTSKSGPLDPGADEHSISHTIM